MKSEMSEQAYGYVGIDPKTDATTRAWFSLQREVRTSMNVLNSHMLMYYIGWLDYITMAF